MSAFDSLGQEDVFQNGRRDLLKFRGTLSVGIKSKAKCVVLMGVRQQFNTTALKIIIDIYEYGTFCWLKYYRLSNVMGVYE